MIAVGMCVSSSEETVKVFCDNMNFSSSIKADAEKAVVERKVPEGVSKTYKKFNVECSIPNLSPVTLGNGALDFHFGSSLIGSSLGKRKIENGEERTTESSYTNEEKSNCDDTISDLSSSDTAVLRGLNQILESKGEVMKTSINEALGQLSAQMYDALVNVTKQAPGKSVISVKGILSSGQCYLFFEGRHEQDTKVCELHFLGIDNIRILPNVTGRDSGTSQELGEFKRDDVELMLAKLIFFAMYELPTESS